MRFNNQTNPLPNTIYKVGASAYHGSNRYRIENRTPFVLYLAPNEYTETSALKNNSLISVLPFNSASFEYNEGFSRNSSYSWYLDDTGVTSTLPSTINTEVNVIAFAPNELATEQNNSNLLGLLNPSSIDNAPNYPLDIVFNAPNQTAYTPTVDLNGWNGYYVSVRSLYDSGLSTAPVVINTEFADDTGFTQNLLNTYIHACNRHYGYIPRIRRYSRIRVTNTPVLPVGVTSQTIRVTLRRYQDDIPLSMMGQNLHPDVLDINTVPTGVAYSTHLAVNPPFALVGAWADTYMQIKLAFAGTSFINTQFYTLTLYPNTNSLITIPVVTPFFLNVLTDVSANPRRFSVSSLQIQNG